MNEAVTDEERPGIGVLTWRAKYRRSGAGGVPERGIADI